MGITEHPLFKSEQRCCVEKRVALGLMKKQMLSERGRMFLSQCKKMGWPGKG